MSYIYIFLRTEMCNGSYKACAGVCVCMCVSRDQKPFAKCFLLVGGGTLNRTLLFWFYKRTVVYVSSICV